MERARLLLRRALLPCRPPPGAGAHGLAAPVGRAGEATLRATAAQAWVGRASTPARAPPARGWACLPGRPEDEEPRNPRAWRNPKNKFLPSKWYVDHPPVGSVAVAGQRLPIADVGVQATILRMLYLHGPLTAGQLWKLVEAEGDLRFETAELLSKTNPRYAFALGSVPNSMTEMQSALRRLVTRKQVDVMTAKMATKKGYHMLRTKRREVALELDAELAAGEVSDRRVTAELAMADGILGEGFDAVDETKHVYVGHRCMRFPPKSGTATVRFLARVHARATGQPRKKGRKGSSDSESTLDTFKRGLDVLFGTDDPSKSTAQRSR